MPATKSEKINFRLSIDLLQRLKEEEEKTGATTAEIIRRAIKQYLDTSEKIRNFDLEAYRKEADEQSKYIDKILNEIDEMQSRRRNLDEMFEKLKALG